MRNFYFLVLFFIVQYQIAAPSLRQIAQCWTLSKEYKPRDTDACEELLILQFKSSDYSKKDINLCAKYVGDSTYHFYVRNYARILLGIIQKDLCLFSKEGEQVALKYAESARYNFLVALVFTLLSPKSRPGAFRDTQIRIVNYANDSIEDSRYFWLVKKITPYEVNEMFQKILDNPDMAQARLQRF